MKVRRKPTGSKADVVAATPVRRDRGTAARGRRSAEPRGQRSGPQTAPTPHPVERPARPKNASQAKARAKARKAKAPKAIRIPLRERLVARLAGVDLHPRTLLAKVPFVVLVIGSLAIGLAITLWLSTDAAQRSYQLGSARALNDALLQQKEALERDVLEAESAPALADAARNLGMIPSRDTAHLVQDPAGNWVVVGQPKPAEGVPPPPLNSKLPEEKPPAPPNPGERTEVPTRTQVAPPAPDSSSAHAPAGPPQLGPLPLPLPLPQPLPLPLPAPEPNGDGTQGGLVLLPVNPAPAGDPVAGVPQ